MRRSGFTLIHFLLLILLTGAIWLFWEFPALLPIRIIADLLYDSGRALSVVISGGRIDSVSAGLESGFTIAVSGGAEGLTVIAGYAGAMVLGFLLLLTSTVFRFDKLVTMLLGVGLVILSLVFASVGLTMVYAVIFGIALFLIGFLLPGILNDLVLKLFGMLGIFYVLFDIRGDLINPSGHISDATRMAGYLFGTPVLWTLLWAAAGLIVFLLIVRLVSGKSSRSERRGGRYSRRDY
ncbi:hypothetical protein B4O97_02715 [Marispirochaeta aestuarii]|jgi:hypothetical protein|uniref:Uncharacterized protein n=1 Tax=Marispirochaeta aestuarii TaxID=1963862 RepID=A0A1Y1S2B6_9SPIO|nr:M50 family metallopeptidase [Marispirochaeta aestuarii]ORC37927.1 hypothetical protein B4O97_02715 [Marispirochaeta aestuarii]